MQSLPLNCFQATIRQDEEVFFLIIPTGERVPFPVELLLRYSPRLTSLYEQGVLEHHTTSDEEIIDHIIFNLATIEDGAKYDSIEHLERLLWHTGANDLDVPILYDMYWQDYYTQLSSQEPLQQAPRSQGLLRHGISQGGGYGRFGNRNQAGGGYWADRNGNQGGGGYGRFGNRREGNWANRNPRGGNHGNPYGNRPINRRPLIDPVYTALGLEINNPTPYQILGVARNATRQEIRAAYHRLARDWHPDRNPNPIAREVIQVINNAYEEIMARVEA